MIEYFHCWRDFYWTLECQLEISSVIIVALYFLSFAAAAASFKWAIRQKHWLPLNTKRVQKNLKLHTFMWYYMIYPCKSMWAHMHTLGALFLPIHLYFLLSAHWISPSQSGGEAGLHLWMKQQQREREMSSVSFSPQSVYLFTPWVKRASQSNLESFLCCLSDCLEQNAGEI